MRVVLIGSPVATTTTSHGHQAQLQRETLLRKKSSTNDVCLLVANEELYIFYCGGMKSRSYAKNELFYFAGNYNSGSC